MKFMLTFFLLTTATTCISACGFVDDNVYEQIQYEGNRCKIRSILHETGAFGFSDFGNNYQLLCNDGDELDTYYLFEMFSANADFIFFNLNEPTQIGMDNIEIQYCELSVSLAFGGFLPRISSELLKQFGEAPVNITVKASHEVCRQEWGPDWQTIDEFIKRND